MQTARLSTTRTAVRQSGRDHPVLFHRGCAVVPGQDLAEADQFAVEGGIDVLGEDQVEDGLGGPGGRLGLAVVAEPRARGRGRGFGCTCSARPWRKSSEGGAI